MQGSGPENGVPDASGRFSLVCEVAPSDLGPLSGGQGDGGRPFLIRRIALDGDTGAAPALTAAARWGVNLHHACLLRGIEVTRSEGELWIASEWIDGEPLAVVHQLLRKRGVGVPRPVAIAIAAGLLDALSAVHEAAAAEPGISAYGGVSPESALVALNGGVRLMDPGIAATASRLLPWSKAAALAGYHAPEHATRSALTPQSDVFSVGILLWELVANRRLFAGADPDTLQRAVATRPIYRLDAPKLFLADRVPKQLADVVARALERDPAARFASASEMANALRAAGVEPASEEEVAAAVEPVIGARVRERRQLLGTGGEQSFPPPSPSEWSGPEEVTIDTHASSVLPPGDTDRPLGAASAPPLIYSEDSATRILAAKPLSPDTKRPDPLIYADDSDTRIQVAPPWAPERRDDENTTNEYKLPPRPAVPPPSASPHEVRRPQMGPSAVLPHLPAPPPPAPPSPLTEDAATHVSEDSATRLNVREIAVSPHEEATVVNFNILEALDAEARAALQGTPDEATTLDAPAFPPPEPMPAASPAPERAPLTVSAPDEPVMPSAAPDRAERPMTETSRQSALIFVIAVLAFAVAVALAAVYIIRFR